MRGLALVRREILTFRRVVRPQIEVLEAMLEKEFPFLRVDSVLHQMSYTQSRLKKDLSNRTRVRYRHTP